MGSVAVSNQVTVRDNFGRFTRDIEDAGRRTVERLINMGARSARKKAPVRTGTLRGSIKPYMVSRTHGLWGSSLKYALPQEEGSAAHPLPSRVSFVWASGPWGKRPDRKWMWPETYERKTGFPGADPIHHPGNPAVHYLLHSYEETWPKVYAIMRQEYPG